ADEAREQGSHDPFGDVDVAPELRIHRRLHRHHREAGEVDVEEEARDEQEDEQDRVRERRREVDPQLLLEDGPELHGAAASSPACSPATTRMKTSSSVVPTR